MSTKKLNVGDIIRLSPTPGSPELRTRRVLEVYSDGFGSCPEPMVRLEDCEAGIFLASRCELLSIPTPKEPSPSQLFHRSDKMSARVLEKAMKRHCWSQDSMAHAYEAGFCNGADYQLEIVQGNVLRWLKVTGILTEGTSYYNELVDGILNCPTNRTVRKELCDQAEKRDEDA